MHFKPVSLREKSQAEWLVTFKTINSIKGLKRKSNTLNSLNKILVFSLQVCYNRIMTVGIYGIYS
ncbi:hypothetical protein D7V94_16175 [Parablautia intestinalis]|uniref:Uncharacterized protein n=1 Tax=Parablautia intestinalis TaxID=2320100 RepID=A0A3A9AE44_9FIRM|nr:hypothetical protein D7V94_16175 [Parablautia intestinalis]